MATQREDIGDGVLTRTAELLGGKKTFHKRLSNALEAHQVILDGFPGGALTALVERVPFVRRADALERAVGISLRTFQRHKSAATNKSLSIEQSGRAWKFAEILSKATGVLGSQEEAESWLERPAIGLDQRCPLDLLSTPAGVELVEDHLERMAYGVYA